MLLELHCHSSAHSKCSVISPPDLVRQGRAKGLQGIVITEHHYLWPREELEALRAACEVEAHFLILAGQEVLTDLGHVLVFGASVSIGGQASVAEIRRRFPDAALVLAHPYRSGRSPSPGELLHPALDAVEIFSGNHTVRENCRGLLDWHRHKFTAVSGTDSHGPSRAGVYPCQFDHPVGAIGELAAEIKAGRCRPFFKEIPRSGATIEVTELTIGTKGDDESRPRLIFRRYEPGGAWDRARRAYAVMERIHRAGFERGLCRVPVPIDIDPETCTVIEEGLRGKSLYERLGRAAPEAAREYLELAARWLARLHALGLRVTSEGEFAENEERRLRRYVSRFSGMGHPLTARVEAVAAEVRAREPELFARLAEPIVQCHGDYHPKNIFIGADRADDRTTRFVSAIDFEGSHLAPRAFDVGYFLAQYRNQCAPLDGVLSHAPGENFLEAYRAHSGSLPADFASQVGLFRARADLSIAAYLIGVGKGVSDNLREVVEDADRALSAR